MSKKGGYFLFGGIVGAVITLLFSPKNGKEVRESILENTREFVNNPEEFREILNHRFKRLLNSISLEDDTMHTEEEIIISKEFKIEETD